MPYDLLQMHGKRRQELGNGSDESEETERERLSPVTAKWQSENAVSHSRESCLDAFHLVAVRLRKAFHITRDKADAAAAAGCCRCCCRCSLR